MMSNGENDDFDLELTKALQRGDAPETLAKFLMAATEAKAERHLPRRERRHRWVWFVSPQRAMGWAGGALAAALAVGVFAGEQVHQRHQRELADRQFDTAIRVTDRALDRTRQQLQRAGIQLGD